MKGSLKLGPVFLEKASIMLLTSSEQRKPLLFLIQLFKCKAMLVLDVSAKFESDWIKDEEAAPVLI